MAAVDGTAALVAREGGNCGAQSAAADVEGAAAAGVTGPVTIPLRCSSASSAASDNVARSAAGAATSSGVAAPDAACTVAAPDVVYACDEELGRGGETDGVGADCALVRGMEIAGGLAAAADEPWQRTPCQITFAPLNTASHLTPLCTGAFGPLQFHTLRVHGAPKALEGGSGRVTTSSTWPAASPLPAFALGRRAIHG